MSRIRSVDQILSDEYSWYIVPFLAKKLQTHYMYLGIVQLELYIALIEERYYVPNR